MTELNHEWYRKTIERMERQEDKDPILILRNRQDIKLYLEAARMKSILLEWSRIFKRDSDSDSGKPELQLNIAEYYKGVFWDMINEYNIDLYDEII